MMRFFSGCCKATALTRGLITLLILLGSCGMAYSADDGVSSAHLEERVRAMKDRVEDLTEQLEQSKEAVAIAKVNRGRRAELEKKSLLLKKEQAKVDELKSDIAEIQVRKKELREKYQAHIKAIRSEVASAEIPELRCKNGKVYLDVEITGFDPQGMKFQHREGAANLHYSELPNPLQQKLNFDPEEARKYTEQEAEKSKKWKNVPVKKLEKKNKPPKKKAARSQNKAAVAQEPFRQQAQPWSKPAKTPADKIKPVDGRVRVKLRQAKKGRKLIIITATGGSERMRIEVSNGQQFEVGAEEEVVVECWVDKKYSVKAYQGGRLIGEQRAMRKQGL